MPNTEILVVTVFHVAPHKDEQAQALMHQIQANMRSIPGMLTTQIYRGQKNSHSYCMLTNWEDSEAWHKVQKRTNPMQQHSLPSELLTREAEQWQMGYLWGYSRPAHTTTITVAHLATGSPNDIDQIQQTWLKGLRQQNTHPTLSFAFIARSIDYEATQPRRTIKGGDLSTTHEALLPPKGSSFLAFLQWSNEYERSSFYSNPFYPSMKMRMEALAEARLLMLEPF